MRARYPRLRRWASSAALRCSLIWASLNPSTLAALQRTLEDAGVEFIPENGGGAGVRMRMRMRMQMSKGGARDRKSALARLAQSGGTLLQSVSAARSVAGGATIVVLAVLIFAGPGRAEGVAHLLARDGDWAALEYPSANPASAAACAATDPTARLVLSAEDGLFEIALGNWHWALPSSASGSVGVTIGSAVWAFPFTRNTSNTVVAAVDRTVIPSLLDKMQAGESMHIIVGSVGYLRVPLAGSRSVLNAFKACSGIDSVGVRRPR